MKNTLKIDFSKKQIIMDRTFAQKVTDTNSTEYEHLQRVRNDYPKFNVIARKIKTNPHKKTYTGLTYAYMEYYILTHGTDEEIQNALSEYRELRLRAKCHRQGFGYPVIKHWFLERYPEIEEFGNDGFDSAA